MDYHVRDCNIEICTERGNCRINKREHFTNLVEALHFLDNYIHITKSPFLKEPPVKRYTKKINLKSGHTNHYENERVSREIKLKNKLGIGEKVISFVVKKSEDDIQIHEVLDNAIINIYSYESHHKITMFAPTPERIYYLYNSIGEIPPDWLIEKSEENVRKEYNCI